MIKNSYFSDIKNDFISGLVVFLIAVPLCLGIALASDSPLFSGILAGIIGGIVVGIISESSVSVSGPAAGMIAVVITAISELSGFENFLLALLIAGFLQILLSLLKAGFIADYIPSNIIQGLLCAIGIVIIIKQLPLAFTHANYHSELIQTLKYSAENFQVEPLFNIRKHINWGATIITCISIPLLFYSDKKKILLFQAIPSPILVVLIGVFINEFYHYSHPNFVQTSAQLVNIPVNDHFSELLQQFSFPNWDSIKNPAIYFYAVLICAVMSLETLLNFEAAEKLDKKKRHCSRNRELLAQGIGNILSGLLGGLPITSVIVRTSVNIQAGARSKYSTVIHGIFLIISVMFIPDWLNKIPLASLAAILIYIGYKLTKVTIYQEMYKKGFPYYFPFILTVGGIIFIDMLSGILLGLLASIFFILKENSQLRLDIIQEKHPSGVIQRIILPQQLSFLKKAALIAELSAIKPRSRLMIDARYTKYIDEDNLQFIQEFSKEIAPTKQIELNLIGFKNTYKLHDRIDFINATTIDVQSELTPEKVITILQEGNQRFLKDQRINRYFPVEIKATAKDQYPMGVVLSCIDSRVPVETVFDVGVGDLFIIRVAGNVVNEDVMGSIEFACGIAKAKLILVLGHTRCGAIKAACRHQKVNGYLAQLIDKIMPAVNEELKVGSLHESEEVFSFNITKRNIANSVNQIYQSSQIIQDLIDQQEIVIAGAMYDITTGQVQFYDTLFITEKNAISSI